MALALLNTGHLGHSYATMMPQRCHNSGKAFVVFIGREMIPSGSQEPEPSIAAFRAALAAAEAAGEPAASKAAERGLWRCAARGQGRSAPKHHGEYAPWQLRMNDPTSGISCELSMK